MDVIKSLKWRYATKSFDTDKYVPEDKMLVIKEAFNLTATSYGLQPLKMIVVKNKELQQELVAHSYNQQQVAQASHVLVICVENTIDKNYIVNYFENVKKQRGTADDVIAPFRSFLIEDFGGKTPEQIKTWATKQAYIALGNLLTICALEGVDSCPMEGFVPDQYDAVLGLKERGLSSVLVMPIGYRSSEDMFATMSKVRKSLDDSVIEI